jgi:sialate O-acetylesterase
LRPVPHSSPFIRVYLPLPRPHSGPMKFSRSSLMWLFVALLGMLPSAVRGELRLPAVFANHMVLQRDHANPLWGWDEPGAKVVVTIADRSVTGTARGDGRWEVRLPKLSARRKPLTITVRSSGGSQRVVQNVLVGEVWLFIGPSNIYWPVQRSDDAKREIAAADYPQIRFFTVARKVADQPEQDCRGDWQVCSPATVGPMSGIAYFFSRRIHQDVEVPIGVLQSYWGGSRVEAWTSLASLRSQPELKPILNWWDGALAVKYDAQAAGARYQEALGHWKKAAEIAKAKGNPAPARPKKPADPGKSKDRPAALFNGMVAPLIPYGIRGIATYQGLGNLYWAEYSVPLLHAMIGDWRQQWGQGPFPIGMVQPAPYPCDRWPKRLADAYSLQREAQLLIHDRESAIGVAATTDIGDLQELHFTNKQEVGRRLAQWALAKVYEKPTVYSLPRYRSMSSEGRRIRIHFHDAGSALKTTDGKAPSHFEIAGKDGHYETARAIVDGKTVLLSHPEISKPVSARFAWSDTAMPNLVNESGMPVSLFRTDSGTDK